LVSSTALPGSVDLRLGNLIDLDGGRMRRLSPMSPMNRAGAGLFILAQREVFPVEVRGVSHAHLRAGFASAVDGKDAGLAAGVVQRPKDGRIMAAAEAKARSFP
jgi:hypothetical protein